MEWRGELTAREANQEATSALFEPSARALVALMLL